MNRSMEPEHDFELLDLDFRESQPAITQAMRKRVARAWAKSQLQEDERKEGELWSLSK